MATTKNPASAFPDVRSIGLPPAPMADFYHQVLVRPWWQFFLFTSIAFVLINALFALLFYAVPGSIANARPDSYQDAFFFSVQTLGTIGYGGMYPATLWGHLVVTLEALTGIITVAVITGLTFAKFSRPSVRVAFSAKIAAPTRHGVPHLQFRMANQRGNLVVQASLQVTLLVMERTPEGETVRRPIDIKLVRSSTPLFALSWTAMHTIDEHSPFHGEGAVERLRAISGEIFLSLTAWDETVSQTIHARHRYTLDDIAWGTRYKDMLTNLPDGSRLLDYHNFDEVVPLNQAPAEGATAALTSYVRHDPKRSAS